MTRMAIGRLEAGPAFAEIHLARDPGFHHPLQRPVDGGAADARRLTPYEVEQIVCAQVTFLLEEDPEDLIALGGMLAACGTQAGQVESIALHGWPSHGPPGPWLDGKG